MTQRVRGLSRPVAIMMILSAVACGLGFRQAPARQGTDESPRFNDAGELLYPADYREWVYVASGLGMTYGPAKAAEGTPPRFDNVFVTRDAYRHFAKTGQWPENTMFVLEVRAADEHVSINNGGRTQGKLLALEASVKDKTRFPEGGWGFYSFDSADGLKESTPPFPASASCYSCHANMAAVEQTFVQFYPTLFEIAKKHGTVRKDYEDVGAH